MKLYGKKWVFFVGRIWDPKTQKYAPTIRLRRKSPRFAQWQVQFTKQG